MFRVILHVAALCFIAEAIPRDKRFLMMFGHQFNNPGDMSNEFSGNTGGSSNAGNSAVSSGTSGSQNINGVPGDATHYLDNTHNYYHVISGGHAGYVQHAGNNGPEFSSQSASTGHGTDHLPGKCPWIGCSPVCQDIDSVTGCIVCITGCSSSSSAVNANGGSGTSLNTGSGTNAGSGQITGGSASQIGTGTGQTSGVTNSPNTGSVNQNGVGNTTTTGSINQNGVGNTTNTGSVNQNGVGNTTNTGSVNQNGGGTTAKTSSATPTCRPFPVNCPRGSAVIINGCPECNVQTTTVSPTVHRATCPPTRCVAPCNKGVTLDPTTGCPVCVCYTG
ncbi:cell wall protein IFF6-like [Pecten maximus]|uniref:cell wall protein IFF6-like n=1 Tax=Pecten maximus TaxID=6579 RepID=UPI0014582C21|nr:cell wall protein IFF6-like [Pecten maximus]